MVTLYTNLGEEAVVHGLEETEAELVITSHELLPKYAIIIIFIIFVIIINLNIIVIITMFKIIIKLVITSYKLLHK